MNKILFASHLLLILICSLAFAITSSNKSYAQINQPKKLQPSLILHTNGDVVDIKINNGIIYTATANSTIDIFKDNLDKKQKSTTIKVDNIKDYIGNIIGAKIYSVDAESSSNKVLFVAQISNGLRDIYIFENNKIIKVLELSYPEPVGKAMFIDNETIVFAVLSNELILYNLKTKKIINKVQINASSFSDFALSPNRGVVASANESGDISLFDSKTLTLIKTLKDVNKGNVYNVAISQSFVATAGQDRIGGLYNWHTGKSSKYHSQFLIYATAISDDEKYVAFSFTEDNEIAVFNTINGALEYLLQGRKSTINTIKFIGNNRVVSGGDDKNLLFWELK